MATVRITKKHRKNAEIILELSKEYGNLPLNKWGQTPDSLFDMAIPLAPFIVNGDVISLSESCLYYVCSDETLRQYRATVEDAKGYTPEVR